MRLYLNANSKNKIGYTPDWLRFSYNENGEDFELTLDIQGEIDYDMDCLNCQCKGDLIPWVLFNNTNGTETELYELDEDKVDEMFPIERIAKLLQIGTNFEVGIYPANDDKTNLALAKEDVLTECAGTCELYDGENEYKVRFKFRTEIYW